jgi:hypothetical protein
MNVRTHALPSGIVVGHVQSVDYEIDQVSKVARRIQSERDIFARALLDIANGRHLFSHRLRQIANDAMAEAARL